MGMQCNFNIKDLPTFSGTMNYDYELESYSYMVHCNWGVDCTIKGDASFDVGSLSPSAWNNIEYLIKNRVPFQCS